MALQILTGDCRELLRTLPDQSVHCVVTSPPYFGLRDYGTAQWEGGDPDCDHRKVSPGTASIAKSTLGPNRDGVSGQATNGHQQEGFRSICGKCGARRIDSQIGLEPTPDAYVAELVQVFREVRRVLRDDGTVWINLGDSYATDPKEPGGASTSTLTNGKELYQETGFTQSKFRSFGLKRKDLIGIPWRVAFALQADGWWLRQDIVWSKPNPMPESVRDRCTKSHEYIFLLSKNKRYFYDADAIAEPVTLSTVDRILQPSLDQQIGSFRVPGKTNGTMKAVVKRSGNTERKAATERGCPVDGVAGSVPWEGTTRNKRSVWEVATQPFSEAHFAVFPAALIEPCIKAGTSEKGCCAKCGAPWVRETEVTRIKHPNTPGKGGRQIVPGSETSLSSCFRTGLVPLTTTIGWSPSCSCNADVVPCTVLDPFAGAGTTGLIADRLGRNAVLIELNPAYADMIDRRVREDAGMFADVSMGMGLP